MNPQWHSSDSRRAALSKAKLATASLGVLGALASALTLAQAPTTQERVAAIKQSVAESSAALRHYEWIETTIISLKGEEKSRKQNRCYHGADGKVQKVPVSEPAEDAGRSPRGLRGKIAENKKEELTDYMKRAAAKVHEYVPPDPARIQAVTDAGKLSITPLGGDRSVRLDLHDYLQPDDLFALEVDLQTNRILSAKVSSYLDSPQDKVSLDVVFATLQDGTSYSSQVTLDAPAENVRVVIENSGYRRTG